MEDRLVELFREQHLLQKKIGLDPVLMDERARAEMFGSYVLGCTDELHEALDFVKGWKPWATGVEIREDEAFGELRDAWQLLTNLMFLVYQVSPEELADRFEASLRAKLVINHKRAEDGYTGLEKCPNCGGAYDEGKCIPGDGAILPWCARDKLYVSRERIE